MNKLEQARIIINEVDSEMAKLFEKRMSAVKDVIEYKLENSMEIYDASREEEVIERNLKNIQNEEYKEYYREYIVNMMKLSKQYQQKIKEDVQGE